MGFEVQQYSITKSKISKGYREVRYPYFVAVSVYLERNRISVDNRVVSARVENMEL